MKFVCVACHTTMHLRSPAAPREEGVAMSFDCPACGHTVALYTNPGEADVLYELGLRLTSQPGAQPVSAEPAARKPDTQPRWTPEGERRLAAIPSFIQPMIRNAYNDYARQHGLLEITPQVMDAARAALDMGSFMG